MFPSNPSVYPEFVADQVLTAHDLNESFHYLDEQGRMTRTNLIGIGIVCGLQVQFDATTSEITITKGVGVTSQGYLVTVDTKKYSKAVLYENQLKDKTYDNYFVNPGTPKTAKMTIWELKEASVDPAAFNITTGFLNDPGKEKIVLLFVELLDVKNKNCDPNSCDDKGKHYEITFRPLLVERNDALTLIGTSGATVTSDSFATLPALRMRRFDVPNSDPVSSEDIFNAYKAALSHTFLDSAETVLGQSYTVFQPLISSEFPSNPFAGLAASFAFIHDGTITVSQLQHIQYYYDLFSDFLLAYDEFRKKGMDILSACCPDEQLFPRHLLLGEAIPLAGNVKSSFRHYFIYSPLFERRNLLPELKSLFRRLLLLKEKFLLPAVNSGSPNSSNDPNIRITPSRLDDVPLSVKAIPYYYQVAGAAPQLYKSWNFENNTRGIAHRNLSYHAGQYNTNDDFVINPLRYDLEPYNFLRIEGIIGKSYTNVLRNVKRLIRNNRLPVDVIALNTENSKLLQGLGSISKNGAVNLTGILDNKNPLSLLCHFQDLEALYDSMRSEILCMLCKELKYYYELSFGRQRQPQPNDQDIASEADLFQVCSPGYKVKRKSLGFAIEKVYKAVGEDGQVTIETIAQALDMDLSNIDDTNAGEFSYLGYVVTFFEIPINIIRLAGTLTSNLSSFDVKEYCRIHQLLAEKAKSLKFLFSTFSAGDKEAIREVTATEGTGSTSTFMTGRIATGNLALMRAMIGGKNSMTSLLLIIFLLEDFFDHLDVLIYHCKCSAFKSLQAEYAKRAAYLSLLRQFGYFTQLHPGIQHKAGVPMGGTFIVVYHSRGTRITEGSSKGPFTIRGVVLDETGAVLPGAIIREENTSRAATTNSSGAFSIVVLQLPTKLVASFGSLSAEIMIVSQDAVRIILGAASDEEEARDNVIHSIEEGTVIADFYLPYRCCSDCPPIQYVIKETKEPDNKEPVANAGPDQEITLPRNTVNLDGSASTDPDGAIVLFSWAKLTGPGQPEIVTANSAQTTVKDLVEGVYQFELTVVDDRGLIKKDTVLVTVHPAPPQNQPPVVNAGADRIVILSPTNNFTTLTGTASDPEGGPLLLEWTKTSGPGTQTIISPNSLTTPVQGLQIGSYVFTLKATDNQGASATDAVTITVQAPPNQPPVAFAANVAPITLPVNAITLNGSGSTDPEGGPLTFDWKLSATPPGMTAPSPVIVNPGFAITQVTGFAFPGNYTFKLTVKDNQGSSSSDEVTVVVNPVQQPVKTCSDFPKIISSFTSFPQIEPNNFSMFREVFRSYDQEIVPLFAKFGAGGVNVTSLANDDLRADFFKALQVQIITASGAPANINIQQALQKWLDELQDMIITLPTETPSRASIEKRLRGLMLNLYRILLRLSMYIVCIQRTDINTGTVPMLTIFRIVDKHSREWIANIQSFGPSSALVKEMGNDCKQEMTRVTTNAEHTLKVRYMDILKTIADNIGSLP